MASLALCVALVLFTLLLPFLMGAAVWLMLVGPAALAGGIAGMLGGYQPRIRVSRYLIYENSEAREPGLADTAYGKQQS